MYCFSKFDMIKKLREETSPHERKETRLLVDTLKKIIKIITCCV